MNDLPPPLDHTNDREGWERIFSKHSAQFTAQNVIPNLIMGALRYEALRKLTPRKFAELHRLNMGGKLFDDLVTELVYRNHADLHGK